MLASSRDKAGSMKADFVPSSAVSGRTRHSRPPSQVRARRPALLRAEPRRRRRPRARLRAGDGALSGCFFAAAAGGRAWGSKILLTDDSPLKNDELMNF